MTETSRPVEKRKIDWPIILIPLLIIIALCALLIGFPQQSKTVIDDVRTFITNTFGWYYILLGLFFCLIGLFIAMLTGAPMLATALYYTGPRAHVHVFPEVEKPPGDWTHHGRFDEDFLEAARAYTQRMADRLAEGIRMHPEDWHMMQPVFLADLDDRRTQ